ncbi:MAG: DUF4097 family beta strand repeat-containing protein [bacterium]
MKKFYIVGSLIVGVSCVLMLIAFIISGFNLYDVTNYGNFTRNEFNDFQDYDIKLLDCEFIVINNNSRDDVVMEYHTSEKIDYNIEIDDINKEVIITQIGTDTLNSIVPGADKPLSISIPSNDLTRNINIETLDKENVIIEVEDVNLNVINILTYDGKVSIDDVVATTINIQGELLIVDLHDINCQDLYVNNKEGKVKINRANIYLLDINIDNVSCDIVLPLEQGFYILDISLIGNSSCNYESGGEGSIEIFIEALDSDVDFKFK